MLCCVSRRAVAGTTGRGPPYDHSSPIEQLVSLEKVIRLEQSDEPGEDRAVGKVQARVCFRSSLASKKYSASLSTLSIVYPIFHQ